MRSRLRNDLAVCAIALTDDHAPSALCPPTARRELHSWLQSSSLSGITVHKDCSAEYKKLKDNKLKYIVFSIVKEIIVVEHSQVADNTKTNKEFYKDFVSHLPKDVPRYGVFDFEFYKEEGGLRKSIIFVKWRVHCFLREAYVQCLSIILFSLLGFLEVRKN
ncbi:hypothetical protein EW145_g2657 [Phellinidium pouzarii]|uniref:Cofilin n=1 Tax=Phellinidium pouzarii TaxID=167371 RepID=A0A4S4L9Y8_9AGAM|nr:hypothetical protein EW145_g2657 [Phellinidium pouzarii]